MKSSFGLIATLLCTSLLLIGCNLPKNTLTSTSSTPVVDSHTVQNAVDWHGNYEGTLPCADCIGIKTEIKLNPNQTYILKETYLNQKSHEQISTGNFYFDSDQTSIIVLDKNAESRKFFVGENFIEARNLDGSEITSILKPHYKLIKLSS